MVLQTYADPSFREAPTMDNWPSHPFMKQFEEGADAGRLQKVVETVGSLGIGSAELVSVLAGHVPHLPPGSGISNARQELYATTAGAAPVAGGTDRAADAANVGDQTPGVAKAPACEKRGRHTNSYPGSSHWEQASGPCGPCTCFDGPAEPGGWATHSCTTSCGAGRGAGACSH